LKISDALTDARDALQTVAGEEAGLEAELLLMHALEIDRVQLYQRSGNALSEAEHERFRELLERRLRREPVAYITGRKEFFGLEFEVSPAVLIPRPETETLVECVLEFAAGRALTIADVGTGSGVIAVAVAKNLPLARIVATDVSAEALETATRNAERHGVANRIELRQGDLLTPLDEPVDVIAANLPYVTTSMLAECPPEIREWEPRASLDGGEGGLDVIRLLFAEAPRWLAVGGALFCEIGDWQGETASSLARATFPEARVDVRRDLGERDRVVCVYTA
jgi:release factor glutamine methyltransferase